VIDDQFLIASTRKDWVATVQSDVWLPLAPNLVNDGGIKEILSVLHSDSFSELAHPCLDPFNSSTGNPIAFFENQMAEGSILKSLWDALGFPARPNSVSQQGVAEVLDFCVVAIHPDVSQLTPLLDFELDQSQVYSAEKIVDEMIEQTLVESGGERPLCGNLMRIQGVTKMLEGTQFFCHPGSRDLDAFGTIAPCQRTD
jgi:hypothetical protein